MDKYVAYVSSYTRGSSKGITIYDVDVSNGKFIKRNEIIAMNPTCMKVSNSGKYLYVASDYGITTYQINQDGN